MGAYFRDNENILGRGYLRPARAEELSYNSFHAIAHDGFTKTTGNGNAKPGLLPRRRGTHHHEMRAMAPLPALLQGEKFPARQ